MSESAEASGFRSAAPGCRRHSNMRQKVDLRIPRDHRGWITGRKADRGWNLSYTKRMLGILFSILLLIPIGPLMLLIALLIKLTSAGPVFFIQERSGYMGRRFKMIKFRTMEQRAEEKKKDLIHLNQHQGNTPDFKIQNDPRLTKVGAFLRKYSLDELPQLFNVIKGDMRLVGPRPTSFCISTYSDHHLVRLASPPGMTGRWQISGRSNLDFEDRVRLDHDYLINQGPLQDLGILIRTPLAILKKDGAY